LYDELEDGGYEAMYEIRGGQFETTVACEWSRHYESRSVGAALPDGSLVGWTYWYGGGKHGEPEAIDWMEDAYGLVVEKEEMVVVKTYKKVG
jgi:hypothetical protein